ncbi:MAG: hypothetical protein WCD37_03615 [Chloroflexia bacterium]
MKEQLAVPNQFYDEDAAGPWLDLSDQPLTQGISAIIRTIEGDPAIDLTLTLEGTQDPAIGLVFEVFALGVIGSAGYFRRTATLPDLDGPVRYVRLAYAVNSNEIRFTAYLVAA